jgi:DNA-binding IclR family transcriptional regulator
VNRPAQASRPAAGPAAGPAGAGGGPPQAGNQTLERGLRTLHLLAESPDGLTTAEVAAALGVHRTVAYRLLTTLVNNKVATRRESGRYQPGPGLVLLANKVAPVLREITVPVLREIAASIDATACLLVRDGNEAVVVEQIEPAAPGLRFTYPLGNRNPLDRGAGGIALMAAHPPSPDDTERVRETRRTGYARSVGELVPGAYGIAAPVPTPHPDGPAAINVVTHRADIAEAAVPLVTAAARRVAGKLA